MSDGEALYGLLTEVLAKTSGESLGLQVVADGEHGWGGVVYSEGTVISIRIRWLVAEEQKQLSGEGFEIERAIVIDSRVHWLSDTIQVKLIVLKSGEVISEGGWRIGEQGQLVTHVRQAAKRVSSMWELVRAAVAQQ